MTQPRVSCIKAVNAKQLASVDRESYSDGNKHPNIHQYHHTILILYTMYLSTPSLHKDSNTIFSFCFSCAHLGCVGNNGSHAQRL